MEFKVVKVEAPQGCNLVLGQSHFIKTVEDVYEALASSAAGIRFGLAFCESSGECLVRHDGNDPELRKKAAEAALAIGCGHSFIVFLKGAYPINVLTQLKAVPEVCGIYAATANPLEVVVAETELGRGIMGVVDGSKPRGVEDEAGIRWRKDFLRKIGYKT
ncbi:MAG: adenosine-specific kinase [Candidatus Bathyarchaeota archaeon]|nr:adenosine-specific kinase [Candidatus Bathyarchaeota archaeon]